jgi:hypothetical protein
VSQWPRDACHLPSVTWVAAPLPHACTLIAPSQSGAVRGTLGTECEKGWLGSWGCKRNSGTFPAVLSCGRSGGRRRQGQPPKNLCSLPSPSQGSQLSKRLVQFVTLGPECTVCFIWPLSSPTLTTLYLYFLPQPGHPAVSHWPSSAHLPPSPKGHEVSPHSLHGGGVRGWGAERSLDKLEDSRRERSPPSPFPFFLLSQPLQLWHLQTGSTGSLDL